MKGKELKGKKLKGENLRDRNSTPERETTQGNFPFSRRRGMTLVMALIIVLFGSILIVGGFELAMSSKKLSTARSRRYSDQMLASDYIEKAKGAILHKMSSSNRAMHPSLGSDWKVDPRPIFGAVDDLLINDPDLHADTVEKGRRVLLEVFDLTYETSQVGSAIPNDPAELRRLPPVLNLTSTQIGSGSSMKNVGKAPGAPNVVDAPDTTGSSRIDLDYFGAYLIRVQLFRLPASPGDKPIRVTEEAFFQVLDPKNDP
ncbi:MAG: hypothetical protein LBQ42_06600 [Synergistaceae bacterium]|nr:hypothetical protein [Synergistaceae bacterium]